MVEILIEMGSTWLDYIFYDMSESDLSLSSIGGFIINPSKLPQTLVLVIRRPLRKFQKIHFCDCLSPV
jgi:hypothetical protein